MNAKNSKQTLDLQLKVPQPGKQFSKKFVVFTGQQLQLLNQTLKTFWAALQEQCAAMEELRSSNQALIATHKYLEEERQRYQDLFNFAPDGYLVTDIKGTISQANYAAAKLLNIDQKYLIGKKLISFIPETDRQAFRVMLTQLYGMKRLQEWEVRLSRRDNTVCDAAMTVVTVYDGNNKAIALRWQLREITARKQAEEQLRELQLQNLQLVEADRLKSQFLSIMSHELRTPLNAILGFSHVLLRRFRPNVEQQPFNMVENIYSNSKHLLSLVEDILDYTKLKAKRLELELETFDLAELVKTTAEEMRSLAEHKNINLQVYLAQPSIFVVNDPSRMHQIIANLLDNAIKYTESGSVVIELTELPKDKLAIAVVDTGIGIGEKDLKLIFQEFRQANQSLARCQGGTGLGLAITDALVQLMQGTIYVESSLGQGSTFRVELPRTLSAK
ncbi:PAS domain-containing sensor histidine kinase [Scytonema hofmannii FACHB-248]|uniref:histidine kinase n=1 Tax=Scytonema hofmannii FACHB-248 TaxID=1842502 RepID=A0ABR8GMC5_9CYAN|nr:MULTISPECIES: PAS domain-containing sensor histidine kinase [Nostocales]MBD2604220.1 PAS domain-containing sensor histidine kinase [Scytonema hofmannii FACHB-248]